VNIFLKVALAYLENHPEQIEQLIAAIVEWATAEIKKIPKATA
jgi:hypothetical protein